MRQFMSGQILTLVCNDRPGLVADVAGSIAQNGGNILEASQFDDVETGRFFMRIYFDVMPGGEAMFRSAFADLAQANGMEWSLSRHHEKRRVLIFVSTSGH